MGRAKRNHRLRDAFDGFRCRSTYPAAPARIDCHSSRCAAKLAGGRRLSPWLRAAEPIMFEGHDPYLVALSVVIAILGGYTGFGLAARIRGTPGVSRRLLLAGAA